ncbi:hypothetical protein P692DRAFT_20723762 [Suillus brevipes Sb2]|jgi:hypothetical protein|nr:hypothetical protein P692DRAFT_20723762 [Suillus brevipes Sb2]
MHLSFRVVLAAIAALTVSMAVSADTECYSSGQLCSSKAQCCSGYNCVPVLDTRFDEVSTSCFIQGLLTYQHYSLTTKIDVRHNEPK